ncbi:Phospholipase A2 isozymes PA3A/PA3B/PA5 [Eufriesea mexicana]|nr:Phospholipase A2 isozymes PA3A/PA3B/PA5 [Eufriesea mexicana]
MSSTGWILFLIVMISSNSVQQPTFFKNTFKGLNGIIQKTMFDRNEIRAVYYYDQTVAVVDLGTNNELHNCNLIEMTKLMQQCELLDKIQHDGLSTSMSHTVSKGNREVGSVLSLFSGILPGTKWCGAGDIAENYHDLGQEAQIDRCCRSHDLCPVKVRAQQTRYNLTNYSIYTKSHCACDEALYHCLKATTHSTAHIMGHIYFNVIKVPCIEDIPEDKQTSIELKRRFIPVKTNY